MFFFHEIVERKFSEKLILPKLRRMMFGERAVSPDIGDDVLRWLSLPKLEVLPTSLIDSTANDSDDFLSFLTRSSTPLRELVLGNHMDIVPLTELCLLPDLRRFEMWDSDARRWKNCLRP
jgi:hypothetical protein